MALTGFTIDTCNLALPGAGTIDYVPLDEVDTDAFEEAILPSTYNQQAPAGVSTWYTLPYAPGSAEFSEDQQTPDQGNFYRVAVSAFLPIDSTAVRGELQNMRNRRYLLRLTRGSMVLLLGSPERGLRFSADFKSGNDGGDNRGHRVTFNGVSLIKSPGYVPVF
jgi:hypothetical protein